MADESVKVAASETSSEDVSRARREDEESLQEVRNELQRQRNITSAASNITGVKVPDLDNTEYVEPVPDPYNKAITYLERHNIIQLFQNMTSHIVYQRPEEPIDFLIGEVEDMIKARTPRSESPKDT